MTWLRRIVIALLIVVVLAYIGEHSLGMPRAY